MVVAADGHRLAVNKLSNAVALQKELRIIIPRKGVLELQRVLGEGEDEVNLSVGNNHLRVTSGGVTLP